MYAAKADAGTIAAIKGEASRHGDSPPLLRAGGAGPLQRDGWRTIEAADGPAGLATIRPSSNPDTAEIPLAFLTALVTTTDQPRGDEAGGVAYLIKPFAPPALTASLGRVMDALGRERVDRTLWLRAILALEERRSRAGAPRSTCFLDRPPILAILTAS